MVIQVRRQLFYGALLPMPTRCSAPQASALEVLVSEQSLSEASATEVNSIKVDGLSAAFLKANETVGQLGL